jgi:transcription initiation factor IIE alpha subunit
MYRTETDVYIENLLVNEYKLKKNTAKFFGYMLSLFDVTETIQSGSEKLAKQYGVGGRCMRNYLKELSDMKLIHIRPYRNQDDPKKKYIEYTIYTKTYRTEEIINNVEYWKKQQRDVYFVRDKNKQSQNNHRRY